MELIDALKKAKPEDLATLREEIAELEKKLAGLRNWEKIVSLAINGPKERKKPVRNKPPADGPPKPAGQGRSPSMTPQRRACLRYLLHQGKMLAFELQKALGLQSAETTEALKCSWFAMDGEGKWSLSDSGKSVAPRI